MGQAKKMGYNTRHSQDFLLTSPIFMVEFRYTVNCRQADETMENVRGRQRRRLDYGKFFF